MQGQWEEIGRAGGEALLVVQAPPALLAAFLKRRPLPFPAVSDPSRASYQAFGLERTTRWKALRPRLLLRYLRLIFRNWPPDMPNGKEDVLQLGGDFVLDAEGRLHFVYRSADPTDRPGVDVLLGAVRAAAERAPQA